MSSQDTYHGLTLQQTLDIDIEQTIKDIISMDKRREGGDAEKKDTNKQSLKQMQRFLREQKEENDILKKKNEELKITRDDTQIVKDTLKEEMRHLLTLSRAVSFKKDT